MIYFKISEPSYTCPLSFSDGYSYLLILPPQEIKKKALFCFAYFNLCDNGLDKKAKSRS